MTHSLNLTLRFHQKPFLQLLFSLRFGLVLTYLLYPPEVGLKIYNKCLFFFISYLCLLLELLAQEVEAVVVLWVRVSVNLLKG